MRSSVLSVVSCFLLGCATGPAAAPSASEGGCNGGSPAQAEESFNLVVEQAWTDHDQYVAGADDFDVNATVYNEGPDQATFRLRYTMISDMEQTLGDDEGAFTGATPHTLAAGQALDVTDSMMSMPVDESSWCHWEVETVLTSWLFEDTDVGDNRAETNTFEVVQP